MEQTLEQIREKAKIMDQQRKSWFLDTMKKFVILKPADPVPCLRKATLGFGIAYGELKDWMEDLGYEADDGQFEVNGWQGDFWDTYRLTSPENHPGYVKTLYITGTMSTNDYMIMF